ncbi:putative F-box protein At3g10430 [Prosopis cineraria]|uniref:putative F-box protein At3g10430 n=1 Tax=Prosopis cineraria TaxID=364024 RepID=UPI00240F96F0|nr:putative F-box protein At3g10430 [Prosopis cineraria]
MKLKRTGMDSDMPFLSEGIIINILKRLPVKSLSRFKCVCKRWKDVIKTPSFIADHLQHSSQQKPSLLMEWYADHGLRLLDCGMQIREVQNAPLIDSLEDASIVGSCNGLLCVEIDEDDGSIPPLLLWNPATTAVRHVPRNRNDFIDYHDWVEGFGFSPIVNDYKIVRTYAEFDDGFDDELKGVEAVEVFSLSRGSWEGIDIGNLKGVNLHSDTVTANGAMFWFGSKLGSKDEGEDDVEMIVSFDIAKEVFTLIPRPDLDYNADGMLTVYENKLAILCGLSEDDDEPSYLIGLWVLDEGTCESEKIWSWNKRYTSSPFSFRLDPLTIWRDEIVCKPCSKEDNAKGRNALYLINLTTNEVKSFVYPDYVSSISNYAESLVPVGSTLKNLDPRS